MTTDWDKIKQDFRKFIKDVQIYDDFDTKLKLLKSNKLKGDYFEYFSKLYFELLPSSKELFKKMYLYTEISTKSKEKHNLPTKDKGIDGLVSDHYGKKYAVQVKFRSNQNKIPFGDLATFPALAFGTNVKKIEGGIMFTNCYDVCDEIKGDKYTNITYDCFDKCDTAFWKNVRKYTKSQKKNKYKVMAPLQHQENIFPLIKSHYEVNDNGRLYLPCGTGKTFIGYWSAIKVLDCDKIFIVVPSLYLLSETYSSWLTELQYIRPRYKFTLIGSDIENRNTCEYKPTTDIKQIKKNLREFEKHVVITTYQSCDILLKACKKLKFTFDIGIFDEAHRTVGEHNKTFTCLLKNKSDYNIAKKRMFMTATEKKYNCIRSKLSKGEIDDKVLSMDNEDIYGKVIYKYSTRQAINDGQLVDYKIVAPYISTDMYDEMIEENEIVSILSEEYEMELILECVAIKQAMEECKFTHLLIFSNTNKKALKIHEIIDKLYEDDNEMYRKCLSGDDKMTIRRSEVRDFERVSRGIISSARIFGEGVNIKICDAVCFSDNKGSTIDIVQYVGRCLRKYDLKPDKIGYVLIPFLLEKDYEDNFFDNENKSYLKLRKILKTLGDTDEMITENFMLMNCGKKNICGVNDNRAEYIQELEISKTELNINTFSQQIISKIFDRTGNSSNRIRNMVIHENKRRSNNKINIIYSKGECIKFLKKCGIKEDDFPKTNNWIKYCLGVKQFDKIKKEYYYDKNDFINACNTINIKTYNDYDKKYLKDVKLPSLECINAGFYIDLDPKFNLQIWLFNDDEDNDI
jgi:predicted helicase